MIYKSFCLQRSYLQITLYFCQNMNFTLKPIKLNRPVNIPRHNRLNLSPKNILKVPNQSQPQIKVAHSRQKQTLKLFTRLANKKQKQSQKNQLRESLQQLCTENLLKKQINTKGSNIEEDSIQKEKMLTTKATNHNESIHNQSSIMNVSRERALKDQIQHFKIIKAHEIADIAIKAQIQIDKVMKRLLPKLEKDLFDCIKAIFDLQESIIDSGTKKNTKRSPKQLGSTIQHTFTPKTISTPGIQFSSNSASGTQVNQFSIRQTQFTLGNNSSQKKKTQATKEKKENLKQKKVRILEQKKVSEFNLVIPQKRLPLSKKIKDKIMNNSKRTQLK